MPGCKTLLILQPANLFLAGAAIKTMIIISSLHLLYEIVYSKVLAFKNFTLKSTRKKCLSKVR